MADPDSICGGATVDQPTEHNSEEVSESSQTPAKVRHVITCCLAAVVCKARSSHRVVFQVSESPQPPPLRSGWSQIVKGKAVAAEDAAESASAVSSTAVPQAEREREASSQQHKASARGGGRHGERKNHGSKAAAYSRPHTRGNRGAEQSDAKQQADVPADKKRQDAAEEPAEQTAEEAPKVTTQYYLSA